MRGFLFFAFCSALFADDLGYIEMPASDDGSYVLVSPVGSNRAWAKPETVRALKLVAREWKSRHPDGPILRIGDIAKQDGSDFPPHKTHKDGCAVDITTRGPNICHISFDNQDLTAELAQLFIDLGARQILYNHERVQKVDPSIVMKWPKHDDHFHVVIDPKRVPAEGEPVIVAGEKWRGGSYLGTDRYESGAFRLSWRSIPDRGIPLITRLVVRDAGGNELFSRGPWLDLERSCSVEIPLENGGEYQWSIEVAPPGALGESWTAGLGPLRFLTDFDAPTARVPEAGGEEVDENPTLTWNFEDPGGAEQGGFTVDISTDPRLKKIQSLQPVNSSKSSYRLPGKLRRGRRYFWRVRVSDGRGNEGTSEWTWFKTSRKYRFVPPSGLVDAEILNLRSGPGTKHRVLAKLERGQRVYILSEDGSWLYVTLAIDGKVLEGFVHSSYIDREAGSE